MRPACRSAPRRARAAVAATLRAPVLFWAALFAPVLFWAAPAARAADAAAADAAGAKALQALLLPLRSMSAEFRQRVSEEGETVQEITGHLSLRRPGRFTWVSQPPDAQTIVSDGDTLWRYDADLEQVVVTEISERFLSESAMTLLSGRVADIARLFAVRRMAQGVGKRVRFHLRPKADTGAFSAMTMAFLKGVPVRVTMDSSLGHVVDIRMNRIRKNPRIADSTFRFQPPPGTEVLRQ